MPGRSKNVLNLGRVTKLTLSAHETIFGLVLKENEVVVNSMRNLDVKCEVQLLSCHGLPLVYSGFLHNTVEIFPLYSNK